MPLGYNMANRNQAGDAPRATTPGKAVEKHLATLTEQVKQIARNQEEQGRQLADIADRLARMEERNIANNNTVARVERRLDALEPRVTALETAGGANGKLLWRVLVPVMMLGLGAAVSHFATEHAQRAPMEQVQR